MRYLIFIGLIHLIIACDLFSRPATTPVPEVPDPVIVEVPVPAFTEPYSVTVIDDKLVLFRLNPDMLHKASSVEIKWNGIHQGVFTLKESILLKRYPGQKITVTVRTYNTSGKVTDSVFSWHVDCP